MALLMSDHYQVCGSAEWIGAEYAQQMEGHGHQLYSTGRKATRVSRSTSHGESLAMLNGIQVAQLIANRISEPFFSHYLCPRVPTPMDCLTAQNLNLVLVPIDCLTDCMDVFEFAALKGLATTKRGG